mgnify:CR=1 FL=1
MDPTTILTYLLGVIPMQDLIYLAALCGVCAAIMPWLPVPASKTGVYGRVYAALNLLAQNFRNVANRVEPGNATPSKPTVAPMLAIGLGLSLALSACSATDQTNLRKAGYDTIQAYNVAAPLALAYAQQPSADPTIKAQIKDASAKALPVLTTLGADLQSTTPITSLEVSAAEAAVAALQSEIAQGAAK